VLREAAQNRAVTPRGVADEVVRVAELKHQAPEDPSQNVATAAVTSRRVGATTDTASTAPPHDRRKQRATEIDEQVLSQFCDATGARTSMEDCDEVDHP